MSGLRHKARELALATGLILYVVALLSLAMLAASQCSMPKLIVPMG